MCLYIRWDAKAGAWDASVEPGRSLCWGSHTGNRRTCSGHCWGSSSPTLPGRPPRPVSLHVCVCVWHIQTFLCVSFLLVQHSHLMVKSCLINFTKIPLFGFHFFIHTSLQSDWLSLCLGLFSELLCSNCTCIWLCSAGWIQCFLCPGWLGSESEGSWAVSRFSTIIIWVSLHIGCFSCLSVWTLLASSEDQHRLTDSLLGNFHKRKTLFFFLM